MVQRVVAIGLLLLAHSAGSAPFVQIVGDLGTVDWSSFTIMSKGEAHQNTALPREVRKASAENGARKEALVKVLEVLKRMNFDFELTVRQFLAGNDSLHMRVLSAASNNLKVVGTTYLPDGSVELEVELPLLGSLIDLLVPRVEIVDVAQVSKERERFTGIVIDARSLKIATSLIPRVLDENGAEIYGIRFVARKSAVKTGVCGWAKDSLGVREQRVGSSPLVVRAKAVSGKNMTDLVISNEDAEVLHSSPESLALLRDCRVIILVD